ERERESERERAGKRGGGPGRLPATIHPIAPLHPVIMNPQYRRHRRPYTRHPHHRSQLQMLCSSPPPSNLEWLCCVLRRRDGRGQGRFPAPTLGKYLKLYSHLLCVVVVNTKIFKTYSNATLSFGFFTN
ncbi:hypothetical protein M8C21_024260, partial [Ambrosia artemisiifolia]